MNSVNSILSQRKIQEEDRLLGSQFQPGPYDVICTRGKAAYHHRGNIHFRNLVRDHQEEYMKFTTKMEKSLAVIAIVDKIRNLSPDGGFVKFCSTSTNSCYVALADHKAREKVGHALRELVNNSRSNKRNPTKWKEGAKKITVKKERDESEPLPWKTAQQRASLLKLFAGAHNQEPTSATLPSEERIEDVLSADDIVMESCCHFNVLLDDADVSFADIIV